MNTLVVQIDSPGVSNLADAGQAVLLLRTVPGQPRYLVAWLVQPPVELIRVTWADAYWVYGATGPLAPGAIIEISFQAAASAGDLYPLGPAGFRAGQPIGDSQFGILNELAGPGPVAGGLAQPAQVNGAAAAVCPISVEAVLPQEKAFFAGSSVVLIAPAGGIPAASVVDPAWIGTGTAQVVIGRPLPVDFSRTDTQTVMYDDENNVFVPAQ